MTKTVFTIGHSNHLRDHFIALLCQHGVTAVCDVRSKPYSRMNPQFNREPLEQALREHGIAYRFLGRELGARSDDETCYVEGTVQHGRLAKTKLFQTGLKRVQQGAKQDFQIALMCAEKEPLECHRSILVARHLVALGMNVEHIHADGTLEPHHAALTRLAQMLHLPEYDLFHTREELLDEIYRHQELRIAYEIPEPAVKRAAG
jgi:uncharacterized protein (DUF488 family)